MTESGYSEIRDKDADESSLGHLPGQRWEFDETVSLVFGDMLARSIPQIESMRDTVNQFARGLIQDGTDVVDLGCACGDGIADLIDTNQFENRFIGIEVSEPMLNVALRRFEKIKGKSSVDIRKMDLRVDYP